MTEEQRRQQIMQARQQAMNRPAAPAMSDADAERIAGNTQGLTKEQMIAIAMLGKMVSNDIGGIKKNAVGDSLKVTDVDMSKVMPSNVMRAAGMQIPPQAPQQRPLQQPVYQQPAPQQVEHNNFQFVAPPVQQEQAIVQPYSDPNQLEFDLNKKVQYEDIMNAIDNLQSSVKMLNDKVNTLIESNNKKKPKIANGTQTG